MLYTRLGRIVAVLALIAGIWDLFWGLSFALGWTDAASFTRYATPSLGKSSGQVIDRGIYTVHFAIALGILTEISRSVRANRTEMEKTTDAADRSAQ